MSQTVFPLRAERAKVKKTYDIWVEEKLRARLQLGMKVRERSVVVNGRIGDGLSGSSLRVTSLCVTGFRQRPSTPEVLPPTFWKRPSWHGCLPYAYDHGLMIISLATILPLITTAIPQTLTALDPLNIIIISIQPNRLAHHEENHEPERPSHTANTISTLQKHHSQNIFRVLLADDGQAVSMIRIPWSGLSGTPEKLIHSSSTVILLFASLQSWLGLGHSSLFL